ncbi:MAG: hypothetical protein KGL39_13795 [Patescibacteria group bacterium]|nr:hypothetical protein [Patescibacteria group bacterium]
MAKIEGESGIQIVLVDGHNLMYRAHFGFSELANRGKLTGVLYGSLSMLLPLVKRYPAARIAIVWDGGRGSAWRKLLMPGYKSGRVTRKDFPHAAIVDQANELYKWLRAARVPQYRVHGMEADDLIAGICHGLRSRAELVTIYSADRDFCQLVRNGVVLRREPRGMQTGETLDARAVTQQFGVTPARWIIMRMLCGDRSDNIPSVRAGIGEKRAAILAASGWENESWSDVERQAIQLNWAVTSMLYEDDDWRWSVAERAHPGVVENYKEVRQDAVKTLTMEHRRAMVNLRQKNWLTRRMSLVGFSEAWTLSRSLMQVSRW